MFAENFTEKQIDVIKKVIRFGAWGDCDLEFGDNKETNYAYGYETNISKKTNYSGKEFSGICSGIAKTIKTKNLNFVKNISDYWGDGSGDMLFLNYDILDREEIESWATN